MQVKIPLCLPSSVVVRSTGTHNRHPLYRYSRPTERRYWSTNPSIDKSQVERDMRIRGERSRSIDPVDEEKSTGTHLVILNLPIATTKEELKQLFILTVNITVASVEFFTVAENDSKGAILHFNEQNALEKCMLLKDSFHLRGVKLNLDMKEEKSMKLHMMHLLMDQQIIEKQNAGKNYGLTPAFLNSLGIREPVVNKVFVSNIHYDTTKDKITEVMKLCGEVEGIKFVPDDSSNTGQAVVKYAHVLEAVQCISMLHGSFLNGRDLRIRMDNVRVEKEPHLPQGLDKVGRGIGVHGKPLLLIKYLELMDIVEQARGVAAAPDHPGTADALVEVGRSGAGGHETGATSILVQNLPHEATRELIINKFSICGKIIDLKKTQEKDYVITFVSKDDAIYALFTMDNCVINDNVIKVKLVEN